MQRHHRRVRGQSFQKLCPALLAPDTADLRLEMNAVIPAGQLLREHVPHRGPVLQGVGVDGGQTRGNVPGLQDVFAQAEAGAHQLILHRFEKGQGDEDEYHARQGDGIVAPAGGDAQTGHGPKAGGGGQTLDIGALPEDGPGAQEAHAGDDLGRKAAGVGGGAVGGIFGEDGLAGEHDGAGAQSHQNVGAHTGRAVGVFPLGADDHAHDHGAQEPQADLAQTQNRRNGG